MIRYKHHTVFCPSICLPLRLQGRCRGWKLCHRVPRTALPIHFFRHLLQDVSFSHTTTHNENLTAEISASGIDMGSVVTWPWLFQTRKFRRCGSAAIPYVMRSTISLLRDSYSSCLFLTSDVCIVVFILEKRDRRGLFFDVANYGADLQKVGTSKK